MAAWEDKEMRGATLFAKLVGALLLQAPIGHEELAERTGLHYATVRRYMKAMRNHRPRIARIASWDTDAAGNPSIPLFEFGDKSDTKRPKQTNAERQRKYRAKKRNLHITHALVLGQPSPGGTVETNARC